MYKLILAILSLIIISACGGTGSDNNNTSSYSLITPTKLSIQPLQGAPSPYYDNTSYGMGRMSFAETSYPYGELHCCATTVFKAVSSNVFQAYPIKHITSEVTDAWKSGWTGQGVSISVIDDINNQTVTIYRSSSVFVRQMVYDFTTIYTMGPAVTTGSYDLTVDWSEYWSHGNLVSNIAGGDYEGQPATLLSQRYWPITSSKLTSCTFIGLREKSGGCSEVFSSPFKSTIFDLTFNKVAGVARQANVIVNNVNLSSSQNPLKTVSDLQGHLLNSSELGVINLSLGSEIPTSGKSFVQVMSEVEKAPLPKINAVIVVAAGNGGAPCATLDLSGCNALAVSMAFQQGTKDSTIVVGALQGEGLAENIATYSTRAGILAERFIMASGDEGSKNITGTSFAAPRVAGVAAILKQKFPNLTSAQISNIILLSANKDINNDGIDDFKGVSAIYGHGKVSLKNALALAGSL
jgi:subtilisin family serine protease